MLEAARLQANAAQLDQHPAMADGNLAVAVATPPLYHDELSWNPIPASERNAFARVVEREERKLQKEVTDIQSGEWKKLNVVRSIKGQSATPVLRTVC